MVGGPTAVMMNLITLICLHTNLFRNEHFSMDQQPAANQTGQQPNGWSWLSHNLQCVEGITLSTDTYTIHNASMHLTHIICLHHHHHIQCVPVWVFAAPMLLIIIIISVFVLWMGINISRFLRNLLQPYSTVV